ncbi:hypothetical protein TeGR_g12242, partial [Tetraparma gracilis]
SAASPIAGSAPPPLAYCLLSAPPGAASLVSSFRTSLPCLPSSVQPSSPYLSSLSALLRHALPPLLSACTRPIRIAAPLQLAPLLAAEAVLEVCDGLAVGDCASHEIRSPVPLRKLLGEGAVEGVEF